jgi:hypothetical protein
MQLLVCYRGLHLVLPSESLSITPSRSASGWLSRHFRCGILFRTYRSGHTLWHPVTATGLWLSLGIPPACLGQERLHPPIRDERRASPPKNAAIDKKPLAELSLILWLRHPSPMNNAFRLRFLPFG